MQKQRKESMEEQLGAAPVPKLLLKMAAPMVVAMVVNGLYYLVDAAFVGMAVGASALSGLAAVFPIQMLAVALATMLGVGTSSVVSRKLGESDDDGASFALKNALMFAAVLGVIVSAVLTIFKTSVLSLMGASGEAMVEADAYYTVIVPGIILIFISFLELNAIRAEGNAKLAAFGMFLGSVLNIGFDALFIFVFRLGTAGAAWGTVAARFITTILLLRYYLTGNSIVNIRSGGWKLSWKLIWTVNMLGIGAFLNQIGFAVLSVIMNLLLKQYGTETVMAVFGVLARIFVFVTMPLMGIAQGLQPIVGYNHGAGDQRRVRQGIICAYLYALALGALMVVLIIFMPGGVLGIFTDDAAIITGGAHALQISLMMTPVIGWQLIAYFYFMSVGKPGPSMVISLFRQVIFIVPLLLILPRFWGLDGIWTAYPIADVLSVTAATLMLFLSRRKANRVIPAKTEKASS